MGGIIVGGTTGLLIGYHKYKPVPGTIGLGPGIGGIGFGIIGMVVGGVVGAILD